MIPDIFWIRGIEPFRLAIMPRPRGSDFLADEIGGLSRAGVTSVVSLLEQREAHELGLLEEEALCKATGIGYQSFPIRDRGVPDSFNSTVAVVVDLAERLKSGERIAIHCRAGIGRSGLLAGCVLTNLGVTAPQALKLISAVRRVPVPDTEEQERWLASFAVQQCLPADRPLAAPAAIG